MSSKINCSSCGGELSFEPGTTSLTCKYCGAVQEIEPHSDKVVAEAVEELDYHKYLQTISQKEETTTISTIHCSGCSANLTVDEDTVSDSCPYCGTQLILTDRYTQKIISPKSLLPFKIKKRVARDGFKKWVKKRWFAPNDFNRYALNNDKLEGIYLPYWTFDSSTITNYTGRRGTTHTRTDSIGNRSSYTSWRTVSGVVSLLFDDELVVAANSLPNNYVRKLEPWDLNNLVPFDSNFLKGYRTEQYQLSLENGFEKFKENISPQIDSRIKRDIGGEQQKISFKQSGYNDISFKHILLPIWVTAYNYKSKVYQIVINARTGEVQGERPWSIIKISLAIFFLVMIIVIIVYFSNYR